MIHLIMLLINWIIHFLLFFHFFIKIKFIFIIGKLNIIANLLILNDCFRFLLLFYFIDNQWHLIDFRGQIRYFYQSCRIFLPRNTGAFIFFNELIFSLLHQTQENLNLIKNLYFFFSKVSWTSLHLNFWQKCHHFIKCGVILYLLFLSIGISIDIINISLFSNYGSFV